MESPSLKKTLINKLSALSIPNELMNNKLVLVTAAGIITGELDLSEPETNPSGIDIISEFIDQIAVEYKETLGINTGDPLPNDDGLVLLRDVTITNGSSTTNLPILAVFFDQIIAVSIGNYSH